MGNSKGVIIPKLLLAQVGLEDEAEMVVERGALVLRRPAKTVRAGWADFSQKIAAAGDDVLVMAEFTNQNDTDLIW